MRIINWLILLFAFGAILLTFCRFAQSRVGFRSTLLWLLLWTAVGFFGLFPHLLDYLMHPLMMQNRTFFLLMGAILILFAMLFRLDSERAALSRKVNRLAQELAIFRYQQERSREESPNRSDE